MEFFIHFIFVLLKISVLANMYVRVIIFLVRFIGNKKPNRLSNWFMRNKKKARSLSIGFIWLGLFFYMFTYWGNHGFGDGARIPIDYGLVVENINWNKYGRLRQIKTNDNTEIELTKFKIQNDILIGNLDSWFYSYKNSYFVYDMKNKKMTEFKNRFEYRDFASKNKLPSLDKLKTFRENYNKRWLGWRFWLLP